MGASVAVIIANWQGRDIIGDCLDGLRSQVYPAFCTTVIDNGSEDGSVDFIREHYPEVAIKALPQNLGFCAANNLVLRDVDTEFVALLNNDAVPHPAWLDRLVAALTRRPEAGFAASKMLFYDNPEIIDRAGDAYSRAGTGLLRGRNEPAHARDTERWVFGACAGAALYRTRMLGEIGCFDEDFYLLYEDVDLSFRAQLMGYRCIYVPGAVVYHGGSKSIVHDSPMSVYYSHRNLEWTYIKNMPKRLLIKTMVPHLVYVLASLLFFMIRGRGGDYIRAKRDAIRGMDMALEKRKRIQARKRVTNEYLWGLLEKERFVERLKGRF